MDVFERGGVFTISRALCCARATPQVIVDYQLRRGGFEGEKIEASDDRDRMPFLFTVGTGAVNKALDEGVRGMAPGGVRRVIIPKGFDVGISEEVRANRWHIGQCLCISDKK